MVIVAAAIYGGYLPANFRYSPSKITCRNRPTTSPPPPLYISTNPTHVNALDLRQLYTDCRHSCHRFPKVDSDGQVETIDYNKLRIALSHSSVVVSAFAKLDLNSSETVGIDGVWIQNLLPVSPDNGQLVGFGRAVTDLGLTASIYDVMVNPSLQNRGIGRMIVQRIIRMLTRIGVYDIAALCSAEQMPFFKACGFGDDTLESTTMMYTRTASCNSINDQLVSAGRGLKHTSALWKLQWFCVGYIDPNNKYCTNIDASGNSNPVWKTKFATLIDTSECSFHDLALHVEVYSREPLFLSKRLLGTATVHLNEFLDKYIKDSPALKTIEQVGSFQLRKKKSNKPQGFVDISLRILAEREDPTSKYQGDDEGIKLDNIKDFAQPEENEPPEINLSERPLRPEIHSQTRHRYARPSYATEGGLSYQPPPSPPPPPPPPTNVGYIPTFLLRPDNMPPGYKNTAASSTAAPGRGVGMGLGAGALAAGAVIFGDDFMSGFDIPIGLRNEF